MPTDQAHTHLRLKPLAIEPAMSSKGDKLRRVGLYLFARRVGSLFRNAVILLPVGRLAAPAPSSIPPAISPVSPQPIVTAPVTLPAEVQAQAVIISINETKQCPVCCNPIRAEARICRFCKATFTVKVRGYCLTDHETIEVTGEGKCTRCGGEVADWHLESRLSKAPAVLPVQATRAAVAPVKAQTSADTTGAAKPCPACGQTTKAEARFCRTRLG